ncbi:MAG: hypothetical protein IKC81_04885 [Paludibacteraceae bacterium]|nr:hypothetical protein [Paludibacteraceae bacterium]
MSGKELKEILKKEGINLSDLAKRLGFENDQRLHSALKAEDVKSGLVEAIAEVTNKSVGFFYGNSDKNNTLNSVDVSFITKKYISLLEKKDEQMDRLIGLLEKK